MDLSDWRYFSASNSADGFFSLYSETFPADLKKRYLILGGPGTGKSHFMRAVAKRAGELGDGVESVYCSSDPESLDGVIVRRRETGERFAVLDATAPHVMEPQLPGIRDEILYMGQFWSLEKLEKQGDAITAIGRKRSDGYRALYRVLKAAGECVKNRDEVMMSALDDGKIQKYVCRAVSHEPTLPGDGVTVRHLFVNSIGMRGLWHLDTLERHAKTVYILRDTGAAACRLLDGLAGAAESWHIPAVVSHDPLLPKRLDGIFFPGSGTAWVLAAPGMVFETLGEKARFLSGRRFQCGEYDRDTVRTMERCRRLLMGNALTELAKIRQLHFSLEECYKQAMDFEAVNAFAGSWLKSMFPESGQR